MESNLPRLAQEERQTSVHKSLWCLNWQRRFAVVEPGPAPPVGQSFPDLALRAPYKIVFEGKYFRKGGVQAAKTEIVKGIYQCFFYLGLPKRPEEKDYLAWDYDYACYLACDATPDGTLQEAWSSVDPRVKKACWQGANIYVMILRSKNAQ